MYVHRVNKAARNARPRSENKRMSAATELGGKVCLRDSSSRLKFKNGWDCPFSLTKKVDKGSYVDDDSLIPDYLLLLFPLTTVLLDLIPMDRGVPVFFPLCP